MEYMDEEIKNPFEGKAEHIPTPEEIYEVFRKMAKAEGEYKETKRTLDENGNVYQLEVVAPGREEGEFLELYYIKKGALQSRDAGVLSMYVKDGSYGPSGPQATLMGDKWIIAE